MDELDDLTDSINVFYYSILGVLLVNFSYSSSLYSSSFYALLLMVLEGLTMILNNEYDLETNPKIMR